MRIVVIQPWRLIRSVSKTSRAKWQAARCPRGHRGDRTRLGRAHFLDVPFLHGGLRVQSNIPDLQGRSTVVGSQPPVAVRSLQTIRVHGRCTYGASFVVRVKVPSRTNSSQNRSTSRQLTAFRTQWSWRPADRFSSPGEHPPQ